MNQIVFWTGVYPDWYSRSIGTYQLSHWLSTHNIESQVVDFCQWYSAEELVELTLKFITSKTKYIGVSSTFWLDGHGIPPNISNAIKILKKHCSEIKFILGGPRAENFKNDEYFDYVLTGEAENSLLALIKGHNLSPKFNITKLQHRFTEKDCILDGEVLPIELGRGCIFKCKFCGHHNLGKPKHTYQRCIDYIEQEIVYNFEKFKTTYYHYVDDTVNEDVEKIYHLSNIPKNTGVPIKWNGYLRADLIWSNPDTAELLKQSGLKSCFFGIESFHPKASLTIGKGWSGKHAKEFLPTLYKNLWNKEINIWCNFIIGLPDEDIESFYSTLEWCKNNPIGYHRFVDLNLYQGKNDTKSFFAKNYEKYGYKIVDQNWYTNNFSSIAARSLSVFFNSTLSMYNRPTSWLMFDLLNCGLNFDQINRITQFDRKNFNNIFKNNFLLRYNEKLKNL